MPPNQNFNALSARVLKEMAKEMPKGNWKLPPLILHPFSGDGGTERLLEGSRASLVLQGLVPSKEEDTHELTRIMLRGRYQEIRMLYFLGKDLVRWMEQCIDTIGRVEELMHAGIREQSFSALLVEGPPDGVRAKLKLWGISDQRAIFSRAIGLNSLLAEVPEAGTLTPTFVQNYHRFADHLYICYQHLAPFTPIEAENFDFEIYASEEYSRMLSQQWEQGEAS